jgi:predicted nucleic-acid-binding Zn-ribbon protein
MILFGRKGTHLGLKETKFACEKCGNTSTVLSIFQSYFHIFLIPILPINKTAAAQCVKCRNVIYKKRLSIEYLNIFNALKKQYKTPIWTFSGALLILLIYLLNILLINR